MDQPATDLPQLPPDVAPPPTVDGVTELPPEVQSDIAEIESALAADKEPEGFVKGATLSIVTGGEPPGADVSAAEAQAALEAGALPPPDTAPAKTVEQQIAETEAHLASLELQRQKTEVSDMEFLPEVLALVAKKRSEERYPNAWREVQKHLKQLAYSGERVGYLEPSTPMFNERLVKDLIKEGFKAKIISLGVNQGFKIEVKW